MKENDQGGGNPDSELARISDEQRITRLLPENLDLKGTGWESFSTYLLDVSGLVEKPPVPPTRWYPRHNRFYDEYQGRDCLFTENAAIDFLRSRNTRQETIDKYKQDMANYRSDVRYLIRLWRQSGRL